jgi:hypothetical protein
VAIKFRRTLGAHLSGTLIAITAAAVIIPAAPAPAQGIFDFLFNAPRRSAPPPNASSYADPNHPGFSGDGERRSAPSGVAGTFCVRLCDGRFFPIQRAGGANPTQLCNSFCPAAETRTFSGAGIDHALAADGSRYASLRNAFVYRERTVDNCTCNGRDPYGLVTLSATDDPTLRTGDVVATNEGFVAYTGGGNRRTAEFTPIQGELRQRLAQTRIVPNNATPIPPDALRQGAGNQGAGNHNDRDRRVQLDR